MDWIEVSMIALVTTIVVVLVMVLDSVDGEMFSMDLYCVFVEGYMMINNVDRLVGFK